MIELKRRKSDFSLVVSKVFSPARQKKPTTHHIRHPEYVVEILTLTYQKTERGPGITVRVTLSS